MTDWIWVAEHAVSALHDRQLLEHGGPSGLRNPVGLASALARARNLAAHGAPDVADLAAAYAHGVAPNHPFVDGNKRTAWVVARLFISANGMRLTFEREEAIRVMLGLAAGEVTEEELAAWFRERISAA